MNIEAYFKISYGLYVVSSKYGNKLNGYVSNTVFQVTAEPPQFGVACSKNNLTTELIRQSKAFSVSVLHRDARTEVIGTFGYKSGRNLEKFDGMKYQTGSTGAPILLEDTIAWFECEVTQVLDVGTHLLFIGKVIDSGLCDAAAEPMTYAYYRAARKGKSPKNTPTYIDPEKIKPTEAAIKTDVYRCSCCGYVYDPERGDPDSGIAPGTRFEDIPDNWVCPVCGVGKADFTKKN